VSWPRGELARTGCGDAALGWVVVALVVGVGVLVPAAAVAHGTTYDLLDSAATVTARFGYDDGEPMMYAEVMVFRPGDDEIEYQNGRTDRLGHFAFSPDTAGAWRVEVSDGMGHKVTGDIRVDADLSGATAVSGQGRGPASKGLGVVAGLSLLANVALLSLLHRRRSQGPPAGS